MYSPTSTEKNLFTISKLNRLARSILESEIGQIWVTAEISNFVAASSGHWYFTLKDDRAQVRAAMFRNANRRVVQRPKEGDKVVARANLSLYEPRGDYQLIVDHIEPEGEGLLKRQFEQLKIKLAGEGLFDQQHKRPISDSARRIGVITSASGAALHDILTVLKRRNPSVDVVVYPSQVQGELAAGQLIRAIEVANQRQEVDVLLLSRGGGSMEDLWCFNDEQLARAIFDSTLPIVSAVGHEVDVTIADFVADLRAPTPSAAAELVSQDQAELVERLRLLKNRIGQAMMGQLKEKRYQQQLLDHRLQQNHPKSRLEQQSQYLDQLTLSLQSSLANVMHQQQARTNGLINRLHLVSPENRILQAQQQLSGLQQRMQQSVQASLKSKGQALGNLSQLLDSVSPLATLARGYSISFKQDDVIRSVSQLQPGDQMTSRFPDGEVLSEILPRAKES